jgi:HK97 family phage prohead protease
VTTTEVPTENRHHITHEDAELRFDQSDGLKLSGYAAVFNQPTRISSFFEGDFTEVIKPGAFARAVRANPRPKLQYDHGQNQSFAIGAIRSMREDDKGLFIEADLHDDWTTEPIRNGIKSGAIDGMSFRFKPAEGGEEWTSDRQTRTLTDVDVFELGPVLYPAYSGTEVSLRAKQLVDALEDTGGSTLMGDLATALVVATRHQLPQDFTDTDSDDSARDEPAEVEEAEVRTDEEPPADHDPSLSAPNTALHAVTSMQVRAEQALLRSMKQYEPSGLPD